MMTHGIDTGRAVRPRVFIPGLVSEIMEFIVLTARRRSTTLAHELRLARVTGEPCGGTLAAAVTNVALSPER